MPRFNTTEFNKITKAAGDTSLALIAARTGLDRGHLSRLKAGHTEPKIATLWRIKTAYGGTLDDLICGEQAA
jgi:transcriptional regulator with XRE-family HTH domain